jgi:hypothetical protein
VAERDTTSDPACDGAEDGLDRHADGLGSGVTIADFGNVPSYPFGVPVFDDGEQSDFAILDSRDLGRVGAPHQVWRGGGDAAVMGRITVRQRTVRRQKAILPHQPQHPFAGNPKPVEHAQSRPDLAMTLANPG